jgi:hypothetical protein
MKPWALATLAGVAAMASVLIFQPTELRAGTPPAGGCENAPCLSQAAQNQSGKLDQAPRRRCSPSR